MIRLISEKYPQLQLPSFKVKFVNGVADVDDETAAAVLAYGPEGVRAADEDQADGGEGDGAPVNDGQTEHPPPAPSPETPATPTTPAAELPPKGAPKADWVAYADTQDPGDHSQLTKDQLIEQYGG
ncbi:hypothetical protein [Streptomyces sp. HGB0020]|uniref:hypothetical protein n=1 Tax=Streptomyces sp. HGB0020 TaxID=1078086 RepID=UPI00034E064F|nr:hypothetical protein [Streptomyces sp. HGB0020]EPD63173.1 hypothetical protein HMPREF1211_03514 [Streptomyces sp. HGB0020]